MARAFVAFQIEDKSARDFLVQLFHALSGKACEIAQHLAWMRR